MALFFALLVVVVVCALIGMTLQLWLRPLPPPQIVSAVLTAAAHHNPTLAQAVETAMAQAVMDCLAAGVSMDDAATMRTAMHAARDRVLGR